MYAEDGGGGIRGFTDDEWDAIVSALSTVFASPPAPLSPDSGVSADTIRVNGEGDEGFETLAVSRTGRGAFKYGAHPYAGFVKTNRYPYDAVVCAALLVAKIIAPDALSIHSDGDWDNDWIEARNLVATLLPHLSIPEASPFTPPSFDD